MVTETQLRAATDLLVRRMDIIEGQGRMDRVQDAYALANDIAHIFRDDTTQRAFSAAAWEVFDDWCAHVEDALGEDIRERVPPEVMADIFHVTSTVEDGIAKVREWDARNSAK
ncbi:hypothetical protein [Brevundimonas sp. KM4]|uniref:hypothetical protein n=1 Tax=Brevundimonas sp. KM4 TaxID=1628191 RepID=UPI0005F8655D|nr:hypothetical protein [Brevundimonas sp. KM4]KJV42160.1 hypothetical protein VH88_04600 [Brevundimonas sp. KM4]